MVVSIIWRSISGVWTSVSSKKLLFLTVQKLSPKFFVQQTGRKLDTLEFHFGILCIIPPTKIGNQNTLMTWHFLECTSEWVDRKWLSVVYLDLANGMVLYYVKVIAPCLEAPAKRRCDNWLVTRPLLFWLSIIVNNSRLSGTTDTCPVVIRFQVWSFYTKLKYTR